MPKMPRKESKEFKKQIQAQYKQEAGQINQNNQWNFNEFTAHHDPDHTPGMKYLVDSFDKCLADQRKITKKQAKVLAAQQKVAAGYKLGFFERKIKESREKSIKADEEKLAQKFTAIKNSAATWQRSAPDNPFYQNYAKMAADHRSPHAAVVGDGTLYGKKIMKDLGLQPPTWAAERAQKESDRERYGADLGDQQTASFDEDTLAAALNADDDGRRMNPLETGVGHRQAGPAQRQAHQPAQQQLGNRSRGDDQVL